MTASFYLFIFFSFVFHSCESWQGGGHTTMFRPEESSVMFKRWISGEPL